MTPRAPEPPDFPASQLFLRRLAYHLVRDEARAEDLVQETWAAWVEHKPSGIAEPRAWLARVLRNRAFNQKRSDARRELREGLAGRPDVSAPETDGTLEAQAQLLEALRKLDEPYRSALVQRYFHDLAPREIAERSGTPLNTIKARLARGLEKLRAEMDRRYRGDRKAWCHWLTVLGAPPLAPPLPEGASTGVGGSPVSAASSALPWAGVALVLAGAAAVKVLWGDEPRGPEAPPQRELSRFESGETERSLTVPGEVGSEPRESRASETRARVDLSPGRPPAPSLPAARPPAAGKSVPVVAAAPFDWPQYAGGPEHDTWRERADGIEVPRVLWFQPGLAGVPSLRDGELYSGGVLLARLDPESGEARSLASPLFPGVNQALAAVGDPGALVAWTEMLSDPATPKLWEEFLPRLSDSRNPDSHSIAGAPVVTQRLVIVRDLDDGSVRAYDRGLTAELWHHEVGKGREQRPEHARVPLCLADDGTLLVVTGSGIVALRSSDGSERWDFRCNGRIRMAPASADGRVFVGADKGQLFALSLGTGEKLWQASAGTFGTTPPVVVGGLLFAADQGRTPWQEPDESSPSFGQATLHLYDAKSGWERWKLGFNGPGLSPLGLYARGRNAMTALGDELACIDLDTGRRVSLPRRAPGKSVRGTPTVVGQNLALACADGLYVHTLDELALRWAFHAPEGAEVEDFVHTGERIYVATSIGLFCLGDDPEAGPLEPGIVLVWDGDAGGPPLDLGR